MLFSTLYFLGWPLFNMVVVFMLLPAFNLNINLGGFLMFAGLGILSGAIGLITLLATVMASRKPHKAVAMAQVARWAGVGAAGSALLFNLLAAGNYCSGACSFSH